MPVATGARREPAKGGTHDHIVGVCSADGYFTLAEVLGQIDGGEVWEMAGEDDSSLRIESMGTCPTGSCKFGPYLKAPSLVAGNARSPKDQLRTLPDC